MKNKKQVRAYSLGGIILLIVMIAVIAALITSGVLTVKSCDGDKISKVYNADSGGFLDGIDISTTEKSVYYLDIPMAGQTLVCSAAHGEKDWILHSDFGGEWFVRKDVEVSLLFRFRGVKVDGKDVYAIASGVVINIPAWFSTGHEIRFPNNVWVNIRESYYELMKKQEENLSKVSVMILYSGGAVPLGSSQFECQYGAVTQDNLDIGFKLDGVTVSKEEQLRPGDNGLGDNGGLSSYNKSIWELIMLWYNSLKWWGKTLVWVGVGVVVLGILSLIAGIFKK